MGNTPHLLSKLDLTGTKKYAQKTDSDWLIINYCSLNNRGSFGTKLHLIEVVRKESVSHVRELHWLFKVVQVLMSLIIHTTQAVHIRFM